MSFASLPPLAIAADQILVANSAVQPIGPIAATAWHSVSGKPAGSSIGGPGPLPSPTAPAPVFSGSPFSHTPAFSGSLARVTRCDTVFTVFTVRAGGRGGCVGTVGVVGTVYSLLGLCWVSVGSLRRVVRVWPKFPRDGGDLLGHTS